MRPDATMDEIKSVIRQLFLRYHPDTSDHPDIRKLTRVVNIAKVLLDPESRARYNRTPPGQRLMDAVYAQELIDAGVVMDDDDFEYVMAPQDASGYHPRGARYDFFAIDHIAGDSMTANLWYHHLVAASRWCGYRQVIKVCLTNQMGPSFNAMARILSIPRSWTPSYNLAIVLYHHAGFDPPEDDPLEIPALSR